ncbi:fumarylacetoacetate hydrolase family protein [Teichococcus vastitatis]|jgi:fumarylacetoacetate (FAA) hydrolase family protein|uniref:Fumarylacetoacetate hydrolase n=1 Tax=Teichococcus vastitatis TaxID=2307076 RepID=A0ABS9W4C5_9PROT|nr:fumarylacetoacetate hydrolase family protein [Pseudoroseomonas vastitatis]MCI0753790.1 fumarylacetoacetate hydrolase [Pseudoroseomonas vastitatis]
MTSLDTALPADWRDGHFALRIEGAEGPQAVALARGAAYDMTPAFGTVSAWLNTPDPVAAIAARGVTLSLDLAAAAPLAPFDLQALKACGVTYARSMLERVIEERCRGDARQAEHIRAEIRGIIGEDLASLVPGSAEAMALKRNLVERGWWSQYLEVGIGPDAEVFTKGQPLSAVGIGSKIGIHPGSAWNNPEPEVVLAVNARGDIVGATLGNDVNLRDVEGRSALLLGKAKDNNAACALGPAIRLFDAGFTLEDIRQAEITLAITGTDGFSLEESGKVGIISRDPADLVGQMINPHHQYPDGAALFLGTPFSPSKDRDAAGMGFTHHVGDTVRISSARLGVLENVTDRTDACPPWRFGIGALMGNLAKRGLPKA